MNILIYRTGRLGDFIVAVPAMNLVREVFAGARITLLTCASTKQLSAMKTWSYADPAKPLPWLDFIMPHIVDSVVCLRNPWDWRELLRLRKQIRAAHIDRTFMLPFTWERRSAVEKKRLFLRMIGVSGPIYGGSRVSPRHEVQHQIESALAAVVEAPEAAKTTGLLSRFNLRIVDSAQEWACAAWQTHGFDGRRVVAVFAGGTHEHKCWPVENFRVLCRRLAAALGVAYVFIGSQSERAWAEAAARELSIPYWNSCGETSLQQLAALLQKCALFVGNDSGPGHLAAALNVPYVTLMTELYPPGVWEPRGSSGIVLRHSVHCQYCRSETHCPEGTHACIRGISVAEALRACQTLLGSSSPDAL